MDQSVGRKSEWQECAKLFEDGIRKGVVQPISSTVFASDKCEEAFRFFLNFFFSKLKNFFIKDTCLQENIKEKF